MKKRPKIKIVEAKPVKDEPQRTQWLDGGFCPMCETGHRGHTATDGTWRWCCKCDFRERVIA